MFIGLEATLLQYPTFDPIVRSNFVSECMGQCNGSISGKDRKLKIMIAGQVSLGVVLEPEYV